MLSQRARETPRSLVIAAPMSCINFVVRRLSIAWTVSNGAASVAPFVVHDAPAQLDALV
jgi:hypothetical protein